MHQDDERVESTDVDRENDTEPTPIPVGKTSEVIGRPPVPATAQGPVEPDAGSDIDPGEWHEEDEWRPSDQAEDS
jgi:hypothetical protein